MPEHADRISPRRVSPTLAVSHTESGIRAPRAEFRDESDGHASVPRAGGLNRPRSASRRCEPPSPVDAGFVPDAHAHGLCRDLKRDGGESVGDDPQRWELCGSLTIVLVIFWALAAWWVTP